MDERHAERKERPARTEEVAPRSRYLDTPDGYVDTLFDDDGSPEAAFEALRRAATTRHWGPWWHDETCDALVCTLEGEEMYDITLGACRRSQAEIIPWLFQVAEKRWADERVLAGLTRAFLDLVCDRTPTHG